MGLSSLLAYPPAVFAQTEEIIELAKVAAEYGGSYYTHLRNEEGQLLEALEEAITIATQAGLPLEVFHLKSPPGEEKGGENAYFSFSILSKFVSLRI